MTLTENDINSNALRYWQMCGYTDQDLENYSRESDRDFMFARIDFREREEPKVTISSSTWEKQEGHYPTIMKFFKYVAKTEIGKTLRGAVLVYLEDGLFEFTRNKTRTVPLLSFGRSADDSFGFLIPDPAFMASNGYSEEFAKIVKYENALKEPKRNVIFWRGAATGTWFDNSEHWMVSARAKLVVRAKELNDPSIVDAKLTKTNHLPQLQQKMLREEGLTAAYTDFYDFLKYKYLIDVDGYHCAWRSLFLKLASRSLVVKVESDLLQWYYHSLKPWKHYVPMRSDSTDIREVFAWIESHPEEVLQIIRNANELVDSITIPSEVDSVALLCQKIISFKRW